MASVEFHVDEWRAMHPGLADEETYTDEYLTACFNQAVVLLGGNDDDSPVPYDPPTIALRATYLDLVTCHLAITGVDEAASTGPMTSATEGSVSVGYAAQTYDTSTEAYWSRTECGRRYWLMRKSASLGSRGYFTNVYHGFG